MSSLLWLEVWNELADKDLVPGGAQAPALPELLKPAADGVLLRWPVSTRVNSSRADAEDATLIDPVPIDPGRAAQSDLFAP
jgi:hypothetical protein